MQNIPFNVYDFFGILSAGFIVVFSVLVTVGFDPFIDRSVPSITSLFLIIISYILGHAIAHLASFAYESLVVRKVLRSPEDHMFSDKRLTCWGLIFPGFTKALPAETRDKVLSRAANEGIESTGRGLFFHCHASVKLEKATQERLNNFLYLYGFARNDSMALLIASIVFLINRNAFFQTQNQLSSNISFLTLSAISLFLALLMLLRYLKFFRHYTLEVFTSYAASSNEKGEEK